MSFVVDIHAKALQKSPQVKSALCPAQPVVAPPMPFKLSLAASAKSPLVALVRGWLTASGVAFATAADSQTDAFVLIRDSDQQRFAGLAPLVASVSRYNPHFARLVFGASGSGCKERRALVLDRLSWIATASAQRAAPDDASAVCELLTQESFLGGAPEPTGADAVSLALFYRGLVGSPAAKVAAWLEATATASVSAGILDIVSAERAAFRGAASTGAAAASTAGGSSVAAAAPAPGAGLAKPTAEEIEARRIEKQRAKAEKELQKAAAPAAAAPAVAAPATSGPDPSDIEIRVGLIVSVAAHPNAEKLFVEKIDLGEASGPRTIVSGLVAYYAAADLQDKRVLVVCNMKPRALQGVESAGMVLCASTDSALALVSVDASVKPGTRVHVGPNYNVRQEAVGLPVPSSSKLTALLGQLRTDEAGVVCFGSTPMLVNGAPIVTTILSAQVK